MQHKNHWPSIFILIIFCVSVLFLFLFSLGLGSASLFSLFSTESNPATEMIGAFAFGFELLVLLACSWFVLQKTMGREQAEQVFKFPFANWQIFAILTIIVFSLAVGGLVAYSEIAWLGWLLLPLLTVLVIIPPIWMLFGIGSEGLEMGPRWRFFAIFGLSMTVGPVIMILLEIILLLGVVVGALFLVAITQPDSLREFTNLARALEFETDQQVILNVFAPYITNPIVIAIGIGYIAVIVPFIEEALKPLAVWLFAMKIESPAQGFVMGLVSGAAFALVESLNASADGSISWPVVVSARAGTSLLHMATSALVGWGIACAFREKRVGRLFAAYFSAVLIHGIWNACAIGTGLAAIGESVGKPEWLFKFMPALVGGLLVLGIGMFVVLIASNRKLKYLAITTAVRKLDEEERVESSI